jgi:cytochrome c-type biogenesis protein
MAAQSVNLAAAFLGGVYSFASPCVLPLVPSYLSYISGVSVEELKRGAKGQTAKVFVSALFFCAGFSAVFIPLGAAGFSSQWLAAHRERIMQVAGALVIVLGLFIAGVVHIPALYRERRVHLRPGRGPTGAFLLGVGLALGWTPCIGPALASIVLLATASGSAAKGILLLALYSLGLAIPFLLSALLFSRLLGVFGWVKRHSGLVNLIAGGLLVMMGVLMISGYWEKLPRLLGGWLPKTTG